MVKPLRALWMLLLVLGLLAGFIYFVPSGELPLYEGLTLHFVSKEELLHPKKEVVKDVSSFVAEAEKQKQDSIREATELLAAAKRADTSELQVRRFTDDEIRELDTISYRIQYGEGQPHALHNFFAQLDALRINKSVVRIVHFGDSQLEGDRITGIIRNKFQLQFGGCGTGTVPVKDINDFRSSLNIKSSPNWVKYAIYGNLFKGSRTRQYGMQGNLFRFTSYGSDSSAARKSGGRQKAWVSFSPSPEAYPNTSHFQQVKIFYGHSPNPVRLSVQRDGRTLFTDSLPAEAGFGIKTLPIDSLGNDLKMEFSSPMSPELYGISFECKSGVLVDNVSMRGSSGIDFSRLDLRYLAEQLQKTNSQLLILQYGVNVVPGMMESYSFYEKGLYNQLMKLREGLPGISILLVGVSDVARKHNGHYESYPNITKIRDAQRNAAFRAGCAFWDLYEAMGGENSMAAFVNARPSLAEKDFTHFNSRGARLIGTMIYKALMRDYMEYKRRYAAN